MIYKQLTVDHFLLFQIICFSLNIDWFNPYEQTPYSVGAIYLDVLNLPRNERFKEENFILVGLIPGPNEPKQHINTFLSPLVQDLQVLFDGITFQNPSAILGYTTLKSYATMYYM